MKLLQTFLLYAIAVYFTFYSLGQEVKPDRLYAEGYSLLKKRSMNESKQNGLKVTMSKGLSYALVLESDEKISTPKMLLIKGDRNDGSSTNQAIVATNFYSNHTENIIKYRCQGTGIYTLETDGFEGDIYVLWRYVEAVN